MRCSFGQWSIAFRVWSVSIHSIWPTNNFAFSVTGNFLRESLHYRFEVEHASQPPQELILSYMESPPAF